MNDFELLLSLGVFYDFRMNDAVYKFKRYEDVSLSYTGIDRYEGEDRCGWDTVISDEDYNNMFHLQQSSMNIISLITNMKHQVRLNRQSRYLFKIRTKTR